jgi:hypothetical protein
VSGSHHLRSANAMFNKHPTFGLKAKKIESILVDVPLSEGV